MFVRSSGALVFLVMSVFIASCTVPTPDLVQRQTSATTQTRSQRAHADVARIRALVGTSVAPAKPLTVPKTKAEHGATMLRRAKDRLSRLWFHTSRHGTIKGLYSPRAAIPVAGNTASTAPEAAARRFLDTFNGLLGLAAKDALIADKTSPRRGGGKTVHFAQQHAGLRCLGSRVSVAVEGSGSVRGFLSSAMHTAGLPQKPQISSSAALSTVPLKETPQGSPELVYVRKSIWKRPKLAWRVLAVAGNTGIVYWTDATTGDTLQRRELVDHASWTRSLYDGDNTPSSLLKQEPGGWCPGPLSTAQQAAWTNTETVVQWLEQHGYDSWDNSGAEMKTDVYANNPSWLLNGQWDNVTNRVSLRDMYADNKELVAHEWGHAMNDGADGVLFNGSDPEGGVLSEGFADCFALAVHPQDWIFGNTGTNHIIRHAQYQTLFYGGFRNFMWNTTPHGSAYMVSHICYLSGVETTAATPPFSCTVQTDCPGSTGPNWWLIDCINGGCVTWSNAVAVPYLGREHGYLPILRAVTGEYGGFNASSTFEDLVMVLSFAGCEYDFNQGWPLCLVAGASLNMAAYAAGFWRTPAPLQAGTERFPTYQRPAHVAQAREDPYMAWYALLYNHAGTHYINASYQNWLWADAPAQALLNGNPIPTAYGISALRSATGMGSHVSAFHVDPQSAKIRILQGNVSGDITWVSNNEIPNTQTNATPSAVSTPQGTLVFWKDSASEQIYCADATQPTPALVQLPGPTSLSGPTAVVAEGRVWLFYLEKQSFGTNKHHILYASRATSGGCREWTPPTVYGEGLHAMQTIEAHYYQPAGGLIGDGRIWLFYARTDDPLSSEPPYGTRMSSFKPASNGGIIGMPSPPVFLQHTRASGEVVFYSTFTWDGFFWLDHAQVDQGAATIWRTIKLGEG